MASERITLTVGDREVGLSSPNRVIWPALGITKQQVATALGAALGGGYINYFTIDGRSFQVIPQVLQTARMTPSDVLDLYIPTPNGPVTVGTIAHLLV